MNHSSLIGHTLELFSLIDRNSKPADQIAADFFRSRRYLGSHDRRFISESIFGMIRHRRLIETLVQSSLMIPSSIFQMPDEGGNILPLYVAYAIVVEKQVPSNVLEWITKLWNDQTPARTSPTAVWRADLSGEPNVDSKKFIQYLSELHDPDNFSSDKKVQLGILHSFPDWMVNCLYDQYDEETEDLFKALNTQASITIRVNLLKTNREECQRRLRDEGIETDPTPISDTGLMARKRFSLQSSEAYKEGWFEIQDEGSQLISLIAHPSPGNIVIDACAGAGGKSLHLAELMRDQGEIIAIDIDTRKLATLRKRAMRAGIRCIRTQPAETMIPENYYGKADIVLIDAPCSGVGTIRRNPGLKWSVTESLVDHYAESQLNILTNNSRFVQPGGKLIYSTCSLFKKENEDVVTSFLDMKPGFRAVQDEVWMEKLQIHDEQSFIKLLPHRHNTDGFFIAVMMRHD